MTIHRLNYSDGSNALVHERSAHVTSWRAADGVERLFLSQRAEFRAGAAIRGGVPIIFPQFAGLGALPKHGFARTAQWSQVSADVAEVALFTLQDNAASRALWPHCFVAEYAVKLAHDVLHMTLSVRNTGASSFTFTTALHTYLRVQDIAQVQVTGLQHLQYSDSAVGGEVGIESAAAMRIVGEVDRIYFGATQPINVVEPQQRTIVCTTNGFADAVVWNPGAAKAALLTDLEPDGYRHMLCIEAAAIGQPILLLPDAVWTGAQQLALL